MADNRYHLISKQLLNYFEDVARAKVTSKKKFKMDFKVDEEKKVLMLCGSVPVEELFLEDVPDKQSESTNPVGLATKLI